MRKDTEDHLGNNEPEDERNSDGECSPVIRWIVRMAMTATPYSARIADFASLLAAGSCTPLARRSFSGPLLLRSLDR